jgi:dihydrolipoamide dehydrogenase
MATEVVMPQMGESIAEGTITKWLVKVGDKVERDQPLFEISTDKVDAEIPSPAAGVVLEIRHQEGATVPVSQVVAVVGEAGEKPGDATAVAPKANDQPAVAAAAAGAAKPAQPSGAPGPSPPPPAAAAAGAQPAPTPQAPTSAGAGGRGAIDPHAGAAAAPASGRPGAAPPRAEPEGNFEWDLVIIGSGPGGYVAGIRAGQLGLKVAVVEKDPKFGGTCLHRGCIPTKALLHSAEVLETVRKAANFGVISGGAELDVAKAHEHKRNVVAKNAKGIEGLFKKNKVTGIRGLGRFVDAHTVEVTKEGGETQRLTARYVMIATGSVPREIGVAPTDGERILNSDHILEMERVPKSIVVMGAGAVGTEFASIFRSFGSEVTIVEMMPRLLPVEDEEVSAELLKHFKKRGIESLVDAKVTKVEKGEAGVAITVDHKGKERTLEAEILLVAIGRAPVTDNLNLEAVGLAAERGYLTADPYMRTSVPHIYAIGDVVSGKAWLAHVASAEGIVAAEHMAGHETRPLNYGLVPGVTFCEPEVASVGLTEAKAREKGYDVQVGKFPFVGLGKAAIAGKTEGFVKIVRDKKYDEVLGVHIIGIHATDLIAEACTALSLEVTAEELFRAVHAHPTLGEVMSEAAHASHGAAIHI